MKTVYYSASKGGREYENGPFTTEERADADIWLNDYYMGCVIVDAVSDDEFERLAGKEKAQDAEAEQWMEETTLDKYRAYLDGFPA